MNAYWRGHPVYQIGEYRNGWALISFYDPASYFTGTGCCWVSTNEIVLEEA